MALYTNDLMTIRQVFGSGMIMFIDALFLGLFAFLKMLNKNIQLTIISIIPLIFLAVASVFVGRYMKKKFLKRQEAYANLSDFAQESFSGLSVIKAFLKEAQELGYAETDPTGDVEGLDAMYKITTLAKNSYAAQSELKMLREENRKLRSRIWDLESHIEHLGEQLRKLTELCKPYLEAIKLAPKKVKGFIDSILEPIRQQRAEQADKLQHKPISKSKDKTK